LERFTDDAWGANDKQFSSFCHGPQGLHSQIMTNNPLEQQQTLGSPLAHQLSDKVGDLQLRQRRSSNIQGQLKHQAENQGVLKNKQYMGSSRTKT